MMSSVSFARRSLLALLLGTSTTIIARGALAKGKVPEENSRSDNHGDSSEGNIQLQAIGALGVGHIQSTLGLIGVIADSMSREIYTHKQIDDLMKGTFNGLESPKRLLRKLQDTNVSGDDAEFIDRMIGVLNALQNETKALAAFSKSRKPEDAVLFEKARRTAIKKLGDLTQQEEFMQVDSAPQNVANPKSDHAGQAND